MPAFHQIGHDSKNLLFDEGLNRFGGAILSPLNYKPDDVADQLTRLKERENFVTLLTHTCIARRANECAYHPGTITRGM
jgi:hypothetical protein